MRPPRDNSCCGCCCLRGVLQLYSVDVATGGDVKRLTAAAGGRTGGMGGKPSPCGKYLAFASDRDLSSPLGLFDLYVVKLDAKGVPLSKGGKFVAPERLTKGAANQFSRSWSPDSKYIVFNSQVGGWVGHSVGLCDQSTGLVGWASQSRGCSRLRQHVVRRILVSTCKQLASWQVCG
jgi:Tol biopolymer transport system component